MIKFDKLWDTMKNKGVSTYTLIEKYYIDTRTIRRMKANKNTTTQTLNKFCVILNCSLSDIAEYVPDVIEKTKEN
ncbi:MAG: helix-turn-helix transcriptional regulator [Oscillospiraceae bacterium]|nr:helix-turn-helix transcriptional regulator [Oscillospiraceae bacterium]